MHLAARGVTPSPWGVPLVIAMHQQLLRAAYDSAMTLAVGLKARTITFPAISCGIYGYPIGEGAHIAVTAVRDALAGSTTVVQATFVLYSDKTFSAFARALRDVDELPIR